MTIRTRHGEEDIQLPGLWTMLAKFAFGMSIPVTLLGISWASWITSGYFEHDRKIAVLESRESRAHNQTTSVNVGDAASATAKQVSRKEWITTSDIATREAVSERTVIEWIASGMIEPPPSKSGKAWLISENYRILPQSAANCGD